jgi:periplasmic divalent cation tolerance protein
MQTRVVYITAGDMHEARSIGRVLVESKLAACVNIVGGMTAIYRWEDRIQEDSEVVVIAKTTARRLDALKAKVLEIHSYDCPCIVAFSPSDGHAPFMQWIGEQVGS